MKLKLLIEEILDATGKPYAGTVDSVKEKPDSESGFCLHQPQIKKFALENDVNMAILISFVFFTIQKQWTDVKFHFDDFIRWVINTDKKSQNSPATTSWLFGDKESFSGMINRVGKRSNNNQYIRELWTNKTKLYDDIIKIINSKTIKNPQDMLDVSIQVWYRLIKLSGLGPTKAAFVVQLMLGQLGCIDSINSVVYKTLAPKELFTLKKNKEGDDLLSMKSASKDKKTNELTTTGKNPGKAVAQGYLDFLKSLENAMKIPISKNLWDVWCDIVALKIQHSAPKKERPDIGVILPDKTIQSTKPYILSKKNESRIKKYKEMLGIPTGFDVSRDHQDLVTGVRDRIGESFKQHFNEACWKNYKQEGMKKKGNRMVPNCVPKKSKKKKK
jgi:hypothetical protein